MRLSTGLVVAITCVVSQVTLALAAPNVTLYDPVINNGSVTDHGDLLPRQPKTDLTRSFPGMNSFPDNIAWTLFSKRLKGALVTPFDSHFYNLALMMNLRVVKEPFAIVSVLSVEDVREAMLFARKYNLMVAIQSSGHSYIGRSTCNGCLQINFRNMTGKNLNLQSSRNPAGEITLESGNTWIDVYKEVDKIKTMENGKEVGRVIVGGSAHTVAMGGYTQGGGHSPIVRKYGLAVDNLLEATLVTVDGRILTVNDQGTSAVELDGSITHSNDTSLFWALRGGGGGTWGAVVNFTFKIHYAPERFRMVSASWLTKFGEVDAFGRETLKFALREVNKLCPDWGGYFMPSGGGDYPYTEGLSIFFNHAGSDSDPCNHDIDALLNYNLTGNQYSKSDNSFATFLDYEVNAKDALYYSTYIVNTFIQPDTISDPNKLEDFLDILIHLDESKAGCTGALIGGATAQVPDGATPVNPSFRSGLMSMTCGVGWDMEKVPDHTKEIDVSRKLGLSLRKVASGVYFNECDEDLLDWKTAFWGNMDNYCKLKAVKKHVDPDNFLWCHNCVNSDLSDDDCSQNMDPAVVG